MAGGRPHELPRRPARPFALLAGHQQGQPPARSGRLGRGQGDRGGGHRRLHPPGLVRPPARTPRTGRDRLLPPATGPVHRLAEPGARGHPAGGQPRGHPFCPLGRDQLHLQARRPGAQGPQPALPAGSRCGAPSQRQARHAGQHRLGRPAHPRAGFPRPARNSARPGAGGVPRSGPHLDPVVFPVRLQVRVRHHRGVFRRSERPGLRPGDRPLLGPGDEPAHLGPGPLHPHLQLRLSLARQARPRGQPLCHRLRFFQPARGHPHPAGRGRQPAVHGHGGVLPGRGQVPLRRPSQVRRLPGAGPDPRTRRPLPALRPTADHRRAPPGDGTGRPAAGRAPARCAGGAQPHPAPGDHR